ncbi:hypothetical protein OH77DRAFT_1092921 [Trametes cingulata]|nr:hypothetical protein OH77DRAFT_1092921 [Trametes cingulata]
MQRKPSVSKRLRKLSDSVINAVVQHSSPRGPAPTQKRTRKISVDEISKPTPHPAYTLDGWLTADERDRPPPRPKRPSVDQRPPVVLNPKAREIEQEGFRALNTAKRPERPREDELPYGAKGSVPIQMVQGGHAIQMVQGGHGLASTPSRDRLASKEDRVPFPPTPQSATASAYPKKKPSPTESETRPGRAKKSELDTKYRFPPEPKPAVFSPFAPMGRDIPGRSATRATVDKAQVEPWTPSTTRVGTPASQTETQERAREAKGKGRAEPYTQHKPEVYLAKHEETTVRRQGAIRRTSRASEAALPAQHLRERFGRSDDALVQASSHLALDLKRSQSMSTRRPSRPPPVSPSPSLSFARRPAPRDVPRDVRPRGDFYFSTLSGDSESGETERSEPMLVPPAPVATPRMMSAPDAHRATSIRGEVGRVERAQAKKPSEEPVREERTRHLVGALRQRDWTAVVAPPQMSKNRSGEHSGRRGGDREEMNGPSPKTGARGPLWPR